MDHFLKRVMAYMFDILLLSIMIRPLTKSFINFQYDDYSNLYNEYYEYAKLYGEQQNLELAECSDLEKAITDQKLTEEKFVTEFKELDASRESLTEEEYGEKCNLIISNYNDHKIKEHDYRENVKQYYYKLERKSTVVYLINIIIYSAYFVLFQGFTGGQSVGKKLMRLKVISQDGKKVSYRQLFIRTIFLYSIIYNVLMMVSSYVIPQSAFIDVTNALYYLNLILNMAIVLTVDFTTERKGIHDMIAKTRVIMMDYKGNEIKEKKLFGGKDNSSQTKKNVKNKVTK